MTEHWVFEDPEKLKIWIALLLKATHRKVKINVGYELVELLPGQLVFGLNKFSTEINIDRSKLYRVIKLMEKDNMIAYDTESHNKFSIITIVKWKQYQSETPSSQQYQKECTPAETEVKRKRNGSETEVKTNNNIKNIKNDKNIYADEIKYIHDRWLERCKNINNARLTKNLEKKLITKLKKWNVEKIIEAIDHYSEMYYSNYYYAHSWTLYKFIEQSNGAPRFVSGLDQEYDGDLWKDYMRKNGKKQQNTATSEKHKKFREELYR